MSNLVDELDRVVGQHPSRVAVIDDDRSLTYAEFWDAVNRFAGGLRVKDIAEGDHVVVSIPNSVESLIAYYGTLRNGCIVVPVTERYLNRSLEILRESDAKAIFANSDRVRRFSLSESNVSIQLTVSVGKSVPFTQDFESFLDNKGLQDALAAESNKKSGGSFLTMSGQNFAGAQVVTRKTTDPAVVPYVERRGNLVATPLTHGNVSETISVTEDVIPHGISPDDAQLGLLPLDETYGITLTAHSTLFNGGTYVAFREWSPVRFLAAIENHDITVVHVIPQIIPDLLSADTDDLNLQSLRAIGIVGETPSTERCENLRSIFDVAVFQVTGFEEAGSITHATPSDAPLRAHSAGLTVPGITARIVDSTNTEVPAVSAGDHTPTSENAGELIVSGPTLSPGYCDPPESLSDAFVELDDQVWFRTNRTAYRTNDGYFFVEKNRNDGAE